MKATLGNGPIHIGSRALRFWSRWWSAGTIVSADESHAAGLAGRNRGRGKPASSSDRCKPASAGVALGARPLDRPAASRLFLAHAVAAARSTQPPLIGSAIR
jgi:hypothetical protein